MVHSRAEAGASGVVGPAGPRDAVDSGGVEDVGYGQARPSRGGPPQHKEWHCTPLNAAIPAHERQTRLIRPPLLPLQRLHEQLSPATTSSQGLYLKTHRFLYQKSITGTGSINSIENAVAEHSQRR